MDVKPPASADRESKSAFCMDVEPPAPPMWDFQNSILHGCRAPGPAYVGLSEQHSAWM